MQRVCPVCGAPLLVHGRFPAGQAFPAGPAGPPPPLVPPRRVAGARGPTAPEAGGLSAVTCVALAWPMRGLATALHRVVASPLFPGIRWLFSAAWPVFLAPCLLSGWPAFPPTQRNLATADVSRRLRHGGRIS